MTTELTTLTLAQTPDGAWTLTVAVPGFTDAPSVLATFHTTPAMALHQRGTLENAAARTAAEMAKTHVRKSLFVTAFDLAAKTRMESLVLTALLS